mmetsp:Transcript_122185/g.317525  ORF Transcript_122185/g.317525 Transcript_122185/m.317525 type:complete len:89 (+) Transcript_122185:750-1016(+)
MSLLDQWGTRTLARIHASGTPGLRKDAKKAMRVRFATCANGRSRRRRIACGSARPVQTSSWTLVLQCDVAETKAWGEDFLRPRTILKL